MTEQERVNKLKARMSRWQAYVDRPQTDTPPKAAEAVDLPVEVPQVLTSHTVDIPQPLLLPNPIGSQTSGHRERRTYSTSPDPLQDLQEARIADLQTAIIREREQSDRLAEEVMRAQTLHAATLYSQRVEERSQQREHQPFQRQVPDVPPLYDYDGRRKSLAVLSGLLLVITSVLVVAFFMTR